MYVHSDLSSLGKKKKGGFKKLFKKLAMTAAPPHVRMKAMKKEKARKAQVRAGASAAEAAVVAAEATPAPQVEPAYYQEPLPQPAPQPEAPQYFPRPMPAPYPMQQSQQQYAEPSYNEDMSPSTYPSAMPASGDYPQWYPPETGIEEADDDLPIVPAYEFEARDDGEYDYLEGLSQGGGWADLFTNAAGEAIARSKAKREQKRINAQSREYGGNTSYTGGAAYSGSFNIMSLMSLMPFAVGIGAYLMLRKKR